MGGNWERNDFEETVLYKSCGIQYAEKFEIKDGKLVMYMVHPYGNKHVV
jgi:hypothetical protein